MLLKKSLSTVTFSIEDMETFESLIDFGSNKAHGHDNKSVLKLYKIPYKTKVLAYRAIWFLSKPF